MATTSDGRRYMRPTMGSGIFHSPKPQQYSQETNNFLKLIMEESRLTMLQRRTLNDALRNGGSLPANPPRAHAPQRSPARSPVVPMSDALQVPYRQRRTQETIMLSGAYDRDQYVPKIPIVDTAKLKQSFQDLMAYGKDMPQSPRHKTRRNVHKPDEQEVDRFQELVKEVEERIQFLQDMIKLGYGHKYKQLIDQEIASKLREMETLDRQRSDQLRKILNCNEILK